MTTIAPYDNFKANIAGGTAAGGAPLDYLTDAINAAHVTASYTPALTTHDFWDDVVANELAAGNGYTAGGLALTTKAVAVSGGFANYDADDLTWTFTAVKSFRYTVIYKSTGTNSTSMLMWLIDHEATQNINGVFTLTLNGTGLFRIG